MKKLLILLALATLLLVIVFAARIYSFYQLPYPQSPIVLDLDNNGFDLTPLKSRHNIFFDVDNDHMKEKTGWVKASDGILVIDRDENGQIDDISEFFDLRTPLENVSKTDYWLHLLQIADRKIKAGDVIFDKLHIWQDKNQNALLDQGELTSLAQANITALDFSQGKATNTKEAGNLIKANGSFTQKDQTFPLAGVVFDVDQISSRSKYDYEMNLAVMSLPFSRGYGDIEALPIAMCRDQELLAMVQDIVALPASSYNSIDEKMEKILYRWAKVDHITEKRGLMNGTKLAFLEKMTGQAWHDPEGNSDVTTDKLNTILNQAWYELFTNLKHRFLVQGTFKDIFKGAKYHFPRDKHIYPNLTYAKILGRIYNHYHALPHEQRAIFLQHIQATLEYIAITEKLPGIQKDKIAKDLARVRESH